MTPPLRCARSPLSHDVERVLVQCAQVDPESVLIVYVKGSTIGRLAAGAFAKPPEPAHEVIA